MFEIPPVHTLIRIGILLILLPAYAKEDAARAFGNMARNIRVSRRVQDHLEEQARILEYAVRRQQLTPAEQRRIRGMMNRVRNFHSRIAKRGKMTPQEAKNIQSQISKIYRTLWFLRINEIGKGQKLHFLGKRIVLREQYQRKIRSSSLDQEEMARILHTYYKACRVREQLKETGLTPREKERIHRACFTLLSEYFTLDSTSKKE